VAVQLANRFGILATKPTDQSDLAIREAVALTMRAVSEKNGEKWGGAVTSLEIQDFDPDDLLFHLCENIGGGNNVTNYSMQQS
jgi:hypothetical protein